MRYPSQLKNNTKQWPRASPVACLFHATGEHRMPTAGSEDHIAGSRHQGKRKSPAQEPWLVGVHVHALDTVGARGELPPDVEAERHLKRRSGACVIAARAASSACAPETRPTSLYKRPRALDQIGRRPPPASKAALPMLLRHVEFQLNTRL